jgi:ABC-2 type transport system permease protein
MRNIFIIAKWEYLNRIRSRWFIISTLIIPLILIGSIFLPGLFLDIEGSETQLLALVDATGEFGEKFEELIYDRFTLKNGQTKYQVILLNNPSTDANLENASALLDSSIIDAYLYIPQDVLQSNSVKYFSRYISNFKNQSEIQSVVNSALLERRVRDAGLDPKIVDELTKRVDFETVEVGQSGKETQSSEMLSYILPLIFVLMLYFAIVRSSQVLLRSVLEERSNRLVEILLSSVTSTQLMSGKILGLGLLGLTQLSFYMTCGAAISAYRGLDILSSYHFAYFFVYFVLGYMFYSSIFSAIGAIFTSEQDAQQLVSVISFISIVPLLMSSYVIANPTSIVTVILAHIPFFTPFFMILLIGIDTPPLWQLISTSTVLFISAIIMMIVAGKIFRTALLMYGKRPTLPEIFQWLKSA